MTTFSERLKGLRKKRGLNQREFAQQLGVSNSTVAMYETTSSNIIQHCSNIIQHRPN